MKISLLIFLVLSISCSTSKTKSPHDPLPSWADTDIKKSIIQYVTAVTKEGSENFVPVEDRVATFDNDGTLWAEKPIVQGLFALERSHAMGLKIKPSSDLSEKDLAKLMMKTHTGMSEEKFEEEASYFIKTAHHPKLRVPIRNTIYQPQLELLNYLRAHGFQVYISSGGTIGFMRTFSQDFYQVPPENVIGTYFANTFDPKSNTLMRKPKFEFINDKETKPVGIRRHIGKRPIFACGNVGQGGDIYMLRYSQGAKYPSFQMLVNHDDGVREFEYKEKDNISLNWASNFGWKVLSMKRDWKTIFPPVKSE